MSRPELSVRRARIDRIDILLVRLIAARQRQVAHIAHLKCGPDGVRDPQRIAAILERVRGAARRFGLDEAIAIPVWRELLERSALAQQALLRGSDVSHNPLDQGDEATGHPSRPGPLRTPIQERSFPRNPS
ncbi:chorismate mutase [Brevundimonas sp.]|uniref:chorismate mutase n=1 Tax=Brevundimonas sp. TaxID=1871086 RepID=UPI002486D8CF|nr:chorismate mutase [Brevundimonas sp.]MDI1282184.1 chorismate mutase [Brevundimonas sp.]